MFRADVDLGYEIESPRIVKTFESYDDAKFWVQQMSYRPDFWGGFISEPEGGLSPHYRCLHHRLPYRLNKQYYSHESCPWIQGD